ncbi:MAG: ABC transporter ATP-binding protein/permease [Clostridiales bacterium]|nr:ABC transporter ATP-binding protein/permease [Clostridiales bacterium]
MTSKKASANGRDKTAWILRKALLHCFPAVAAYGVILLFSTLLSLFLTMADRALVNTLIRDMELGVLSSAFVGFVVLYLVFYFILKTGNFLGALGGNFFRYRVDGFFRRMFMWRCSKMPQEDFFKADFMDRFTLVAGNIQSVSGYISALFSLIFSDFGYLVGMLVLFAIYEPILIPYALVIGIISALLHRYIAKGEYELEHRQVRNLRKENYFQGLLTGREAAKEIRIFRLAGFFFEKWREVFGSLRKEQLDMSTRRTKLWNRQARVLLYLRIPAVLLIIWGVCRGRYDIGTFSMLFLLVKSCAERMNALAYNVVKGTYKDTKFLQEYYDLVCPLTRDEIREMKDSDVEERVLPYGEFSDLTLSDVSYKYPEGEKNAVGSVSLSLRRGEIVSILGENGSGKTTLSKLMNGSLPPLSGEIRLNGQPVKEPVLSYFGTMPQEYSMFAISLKDHVGTGRIEWMGLQEKLDEAYRKARIEELVESLPRQQDTVLGKEYDEDGVNLSGGQWQRVILAAACMGEPEILLLDEPSASMDAITEESMLSDIRSWLGGRTAVLISHRIAFARMADRIIMMKDGHIAEEGTHEQLLEQNGYYAEFFNRQRALYE